ncbi:MAG: branched-chain amino acid ABC transporter permease [Desulfohalobiaceae bacterium]|nr:branched-chain amino acid ABC transporter permease [Desulfohalobiaceae bacterium]
MLELSTLFIQVLNGLTFAMFLYLIASGLTLILGVIDVVNFAHGSLYMLGAFFMYSLINEIGLNFYLALLLAPIGVGLIGILLERFLLRHVYKGGHILQLLLTYGLVLVFGDAVRMKWSGHGQEFVKSVSTPELLDGTFYFLGQAFPVYYMFVICSGFIVAAFLWWFLEKSPWGSIIRASATNRNMVGALGINVNIIYSLIFGFGSFLAGIGGVLASPVRAAYPGMGVEVVVQCFIVVIIGGFGSVQGAFIAALLIGQLEVFGIMFFEELSMVFVYVLLLVVILFKPSGLFGKKIGEY